MDIDQQIQALIDGAPKDGRTPAAVEAIAPALKLIAAQLKHPQYYVLQNLSQQWLMTTLNHRSDPNLSKTIVHAFPTLKDVSLGPYPLNDPQIMAIPLPVTHILFQMVVMKPVDSILFYEVPGDARTVQEVTRQNLQDLVQTYLKPSQGAAPPPDIA